MQTQFGDSSFRFDWVISPSLIDQALKRFSLGMYSIHGPCLMIGQGYMRMECD
ncbi:hypothetical protein ANT_19200 [Anaerolinea thermophila UNI-1]|uniref:Uncharacterized protein n=1 Tax=Anaerolinea thermophila (strain DSM 14523 / JCM 11388 / NBRC 100420 / UNI-1) TaxID=926569 RepID=E8N682_ANATU|nr:hypothetical protein ANT_19200 [Anaerolinea thermophila UNI-1]